MLPWPRVGGALSGALLRSIAEAAAGVKRDSCGLATTRARDAPAALTLGTSHQVMPIL
jgi:hypothetical protein